MVTEAMNTHTDHRDNERLDPAERKRRLRSRNLAVAGVLAALVVLFYVVAIVKMSGG